MLRKTYDTGQERLFLAVTPAYRYIICNFCERDKSGSQLWRRVGVFEQRKDPRSLTWWVPGLCLN